MLSLGRVLWEPLRRVRSHVCGGGAGTHQLLSARVQRIWCDKSVRSLSCRRSPADESVHMGERFFIRAVITLLYFINTLRVGAVGAGARHARTTAYNAAAASLA